MLIPAHIAKQIPALYSTENIPMNEKIVVCKLFVGAATWYVLEMDPKEGLLFCFANLGDPDMAELGYTSLAELEQLKVAVQLRVGNVTRTIGHKSVELDRWFKPCPLGEILKTLRE